MYISFVLFTSYPSYRLSVFVSRPFELRLLFLRKLLYSSLLRLPVTCFLRLYIVCNICDCLPLSTCFLLSPRFTHLPTPLVAPFTASKFLETVCMPWIRSFLPHFLSHSDMNIAFDGDDEPRPLLTGIQSKVRRLFLFYLNVLPANPSTMSA